MSLFKIDGRPYNVIVPIGGIQRSFEVYSSRQDQTINGKRVYNVVGTYYGYTITVDTSGTSAEEYDRLFEVISAPEEWHNFELPYGQEILKFRGHIEAGGDTMYTKRGGVSSWGDLTFTVISTRPQRRAL